MIARTRATTSRAQHYDRKYVDFFSQRTRICQRGYYNLINPENNRAQRDKSGPDDRVRQIMRHFAMHRLNHFHACDKAMS
ncbi:MAG: hypothetical protein ABW184_12085 [Sphingobium sp.]